MSSRDDDVRVRPGRIGNRGGGKAKSFVNQVLRAAKRAGGGGESVGRPTRRGRSSFGRGGNSFGPSRLLGSQRRVLVKARIARGSSRSARAAPLTAHLAYLKRDGVTRDDARARMFDASSDHADETAFADRCKDDRHHFRFIISPEDAGDMTDLRAFTRDLATQMERDLGTRLDWVAVDHWNTDNPHVHLLVRGVTDDGSDLVIARDYISRGLRSRAEDLVALELGPKPEHEVRSALEHEVDAERWTRLDAEIRLSADGTGIVDLRPAQPIAVDPQIRRLMIGRLQRLERMGLASADGPAQWTVRPDAEPILRDLGIRGDIIKTMHRAMTIRLVLNQIGRRLTEDLQAKSKRRRLLLMLDEFPALGRLDFFESALAFMAGYGLKSFLIAQSLNQIEKAYGQNNSILDNCHVRVAFATNDERTAKRVSDALGVATELRAMKNYAGHRLSPWLGHLMVSRQETARPLLTAGEIMQLPATDEVVLVSGTPPIRAKKARYFEDRRLAERVRPPPEIGNSAFNPHGHEQRKDDEWTALPTPKHAPQIAPQFNASDDPANGGIRREPGLPEHETVVAEETRPVPEFAVIDDESDARAVQSAVMRRRVRTVARQATMDPDDGVAL